MVELRHFRSSLQRWAQQSLWVPQLLSGVLNQQPEGIKDSWTWLSVWVLKAWSAKIKGQKRRKYKESSIAFVRIEMKPTLSIFENPTPLLQSERAKHCIMVCTIWKGMGIHICKVKNCFTTDSNSHDLGFWAHFPFTTSFWLFAVVVGFLELPKIFCSCVSESFNWNNKKREFEDFFLVVVLVMGVSLTSSNEKVYF